MGNHYMDAEAGPSDHRRHGRRSDREVLMASHENCCVKVIQVFLQRAEVTVKASAMSHMLCANYLHGSTACLCMFCGQCCTRIA